MNKPLSVLLSSLLALGAACIVVENPGSEPSQDDGNGDAPNDGDDNNNDNNDNNDNSNDNNDSNDDSNDNDTDPGDRDGDGVPDLADNCPDDANTDQDIRACTDVGSTCSSNGECDNQTCLKEVDDEGEWSDFGYCTIPCESFDDCPTFWDCEEVGNALGTYCVQG